MVAAGEDLSPSGAFQARLGVYPLNVNVAESLTRLSEDFRAEPLLATRWEYLGDRRWRFHLRRDVRFHDGAPLDAEAVRWSMAEVARGDFGYSGLTEESAEVVDDSTVDITTVEPNLRLPEQLVHPNYGVFAPGTDPGSRPVGTGPFRFVEYRPEERFVVERWEGYWGEPAEPARITFRFYPDANTRLLALMAGEVHLVMDLARSQVEPVARRPGLSVARAEVGQMLNLNPNLHGAPPYDLTGERALRRAIAMALDRRSLVEDIWDGEGRAVQNMTVPAILVPFEGRVRGAAHDPAAASALLDSAGWRPGPGGVRRRSGRPLRLEMLVNPEVDGATGQFLQAGLRAVGIDAVLVPLPDAGSYYERLNRGQFHLNLTVPNQNDGNPLFLPALIFHSASERPFARWHHVGPEFDRLVNEGLAAEDPAEARRLAAEAIHLAIDREAAVISVAGRWRLYGLAEWVRGFDPHPAQTHQSWAGVRVRPGAER